MDTLEAVGHAQRITGQLPYDASVADSQMKAALADNEAVTSAAAGAAYVENFALRVFMNADNMDRAGKYDK